MRIRAADARRLRMRRPAFVPVAAIQLEGQARWTILRASLRLGGRSPVQSQDARRSTFRSPTGKTGLKQGTRVRHPKYGEGTVFRREGDGDDAKITVQFQQHGVKKLVEKFAQLERL